MADRLTTVAVLTGRRNDDAVRALGELGAAREMLGVELLMPADEAAKHGDVEALGFRCVDDEGLRAADVCLVFGGDGTILRALGRLLGSTVPTLGVNYGNVGFLAGLPHDDWLDGLRAMVAGEHRVVELLTVVATLNGTMVAAVNDIVLSRVEPRHVLHLEYEVSGVTVGRMLCDGLILSTPTGSTAYNLSCDGPIVEWDAGVLVLNFIAPHSLAFRPMVLRPDHEISVGNVSPSERCEVLADGREVGRLCCGERVRITAGEERARLMVRAESSFYQNVEEKLFDREGR
ncbi:MAG TPA: NAD(+)/NADH kinase [Thermoleophilia bacterium]|nr:NAD(+)/NADH kinase [Thermoleophilia bacterium]